MMLEQEENVVSKFDVLSKHQVVEGAKHKVMFLGKT